MILKELDQKDSRELRFGWGGLDGDGTGPYGASLKWILRVRLEKEN